MSADLSARTMIRPPAGPQRLLGGWAETGRPAGIVEHRARFGDLPPIRPADRDALIRLVEESGLTGRGGAGFPTGRKLRAVAAGRRGAVVIGNGCEGEPLSEKDHALLTVAPHLVLDGLAITAAALDAREAVLCVHRGDPIAGTAARALAQRDDRLPVRLVEVPRRYVASEESALVNFLNTGTARPTAKPPRPYERGVRGRPSLIDNVETLADIALIARFGAGWFRSQGSRTEPGTTLVTVTGAVTSAGVRELPLGVPLGTALAEAGDVAEPCGAVLVGGYGGSWLSLPEAAGLPLTHEAFRSAGAALGVAVIAPLPRRACGVAETARVLRYLARESAAQCGPCMFGLPAIAQDFTALANGAGADAALANLRRRLGIVAGRGACGHPDGAVRLAASALRVFDRDVRTHAGGRPCGWAGNRPVLPVPHIVHQAGLEGWK